MQTRSSDGEISPVSAKLERWRNVPATLPSRLCRRVSAQKVLLVRDEHRAGEALQQFLRVTAEALHGQEAFVA